MTWQMFPGKVVGANVADSPIELLVAVPDLDGVSGSDAGPVLVIRRDAAMQLLELIRETPMASYWENGLAYALGMRKRP